MLSKLLVIVVLIACVSAQNFCDVRCASTGGTCNSATPAATDPYYVCPFPQYCDSGSATCKNPGAVGATCTNSGQCADGIGCNVTTCQTYKAQQSDGAYCDSTITPCGVNSFCNITGTASQYSWGVCAPLPMTGSACGTGSPNCRVTDICNGGTCVKQFSVASGAACGGDSICVPGYYCSGYSFVAAGTCKAGFTSSNGTCNGYIPGPNCKTDETCQCQSYGQGQTNRTCQAPTTVVQAVADAYSAFAQCQITNNCGVDSDCLQCSSQGCAYGKALNNPIANIILFCGTTPCNTPSTSTSTATGQSSTTSTGSGSGSGTTAASGQSSTSTTAKTSSATSVTVSVFSMIIALVVVVVF